MLSGAVCARRYWLAALKYLRFQRKTAASQLPHLRRPDRIQALIRGWCEQPPAGKFAKRGQHHLPRLDRKTGQAQAVAPRASQAAHRMQMPGKHEMRCMNLRVMAAGERTMQVGLIDHLDLQ